MSINKRIYLMEKFTERYMETKEMSKSLRELECMKVMFPETFVTPMEEDYFVGRFIMLPIGHGLEWAHLGAGDVGICTREEQTKVNGSSSPELNSAGPSYYGLIDQIKKMKTKINDKSLLSRIDRLIEFWKENDTHLKMVKAFEEKYPSNMYDDDINNFLPPILVLTRLSGIEMNYDLLLNKGIREFKNYLMTVMKEKHGNEFLMACVESIKLLEDTIRHYINMLKEEKVHIIDKKKQSERIKRIDLILKSLEEILLSPPRSFHSAIQLIFLYSQLAGVVNYGRMDDYLGEFLIADLQKGKIDENTATMYIESLWRLINNTCNRGNGRVIVGGKGRKNSEAANVFARIAIQATINTKMVKPQLTLRIDKSVPKAIYDLALDAIEKGCTFPMLYNDELNINGVKKAMEVSYEDAVQYVPYGCGEYIIWGRGTGSPNVCVNFSKVFQLAFNKGFDPFDGEYRGGNYSFVDVNTIKSYEEFERTYYDFLDYVLLATVHFQHDSYQYIARQSSFVLASILMNDCIERGKPILDGGIRYYSGVNEFYGFSNAIDSLAAVKRVVFDDKKYTLKEIVEAINHHFNGYEDIQEALLSSPKFGNDEDEVDIIGVRLHEHACGYIRDHAKDVGLHSFLAVNINNNANTRWGIKTGAGYDGRNYGEHLAPGNNPHSGRDRNGITAMLNSLSKFRSDIHAGYVQNLKCSPRLFKEEREKIKALFNAYFKRIGGTQLMVNVVDQRTLLDARVHPKKYPNLLVRCGGFSAKFVELDENTQIEIINRTCND